MPVARILGVEQRGLKFVSMKVLGLMRSPYMYIKGNYLTMNKIGIDA
jgi:hypothetical protein